MTAWRMAFRVGSRGFDMFPDCLKYGVAAITYNPLTYTDLSKYPEYEPRALWQKLHPTQKASLGRLAYEMKKGDIIYVKHGKKIIYKGIVKGLYTFDSKNRIVEPGGWPWSHQVPVSWDDSFPEVEMLLGGEQVTVIKLSDEEVKTIETAAIKSSKKKRVMEAEEGKLIKGEATFRSRNVALIEVKKRKSDYTCEACGLKFIDKYGEIGYHYIIAHHIVSLSSKKGISKTTLDDIALLCANCHAMVHTTGPPLSVIGLKKLLK